MKGDGGGLKNLPYPSLQRRALYFSFHYGDVLNSEFFNNFADLVV
jgi:hypothetical protein